MTSTPVTHWTQEEFDLLLNEVLESDSLERIRGACERVGSTIGKSYKATYRILWGLAARITCVDYQPGPTRKSREGKTTFADTQMILWATEAITKDHCRVLGPSDITHMATLLGHKLEVVETLWRKHGPAKGRSGFQLETKRV